jgi:hypothetical protein
MSHYGGFHPYVAPVRNILANTHVVNPKTQNPFSEAMLLGIGGGLGAGYIVFEFKAHGSAIMVLGFINRWNYGVDYINNMLTRLGAVGSIAEFSGRKKAEQTLVETLAKQPVVAWVDKASLPHWQLPDSLKGYGVHLVGVYGAKDGIVTLDDTAQQPYTLSSEDFASARERISSNKHRLLSITLPKEIDLSKAIRLGIADHIEHLSRDSESFSLPVYPKWAKMLTDKKNKKGWHTLFATRNGLFDALASTYEGVMWDASEGAGLRHLYADFLLESAQLLDKPELEVPMRAYREAGNAWQDFARVALPATHFQRAIELLDLRYGLLKQNKLDEAKAINAEWQALRITNNAQFPLNDGEIESIFKAMASQLERIYGLEVKALHALKDAML